MPLPHAAASAVAYLTSLVNASFECASDCVYFKRCRHPVHVIIGKMGINRCMEVTIAVYWFSWRKKKQQYSSPFEKIQELFDVCYMIMR